MKKIALLLAVLLLFLVGCSTTPSTESTAASGSLPALSGKEPGKLDSDIQRPEVTRAEKPAHDFPGERPTLNHGDDEAEPVPGEEGTVVYVAEVTGRTRRKPTATDSWTFSLPLEGSVSFGETNPLTLSAVEEEDGTVSIQLLSDECYLQKGRLMQKADSVKLAAEDTVYVVVRKDKAEVSYALWLK